MKIIVRTESPKETMRIAWSYKGVIKRWDWMRNIRVIIAISMTVVGRCMSRRGVVVIIPIYIVSTIRCSWRSIGIVISISVVVIVIRPSRNIGVAISVCVVSVTSSP